MYVCRIFGTTSGGVNSASATHKGVLIPHRCGINTLPSLFSAIPKRKQAKTRGMYIYLQAEKQNTAPFFLVKHPFFLLFFLSEWVGVVISVDVSVVAVLSSPKVTESVSVIVSFLQKDSKC
jgi:hypothetical protein